MTEKKKGLCPLAKQGAALLAEVLQANGHLTEDQVERTMQHVQEVQQRVNTEHVKQAA